MSHAVNIIDKSVLVRKVSFILITSTDYIPTLKRMMNVFKDLHKLGFRHISTTLNDCSGKDKYKRCHMTRKMSVFGAMFEVKSSIGTFR